MSKIGYQKTKSAPFFDEKCLFKFSNVHLVGIHVQKTLHLRETGGRWNQPPRPLGVHVGFKPWHGRNRVNWKIPWSPQGWKEVTFAYQFRKLLKESDFNSWRTKVSMLLISNILYKPANEPFFNSPYHPFCFPIQVFPVYTFELSIFNQCNRNSYQGNQRKNV